MEDLRRRQLVPVEVIEVGNGPPPAARDNISLDVALATWTRTVSTMLSAGIPLESAIAFASTGASKSLLGPMDRVLERVRNGSALSAAMQSESPVFGPVYLALISAGEETGELGDAMAQLADHLDASSEIRSQVRSALVYPALMAVSAALGITVLLLFVVPRFVQILGEVGGDLPWSTAFLVGLSGILARFWWVLAAIVLLSIWQTRRWLSVPANRMRWHSTRLGLPVTGDLERDRFTARFTRVLGMLLRSGISLLPALRVAESSVMNLALKSSVAGAIDGVSQGRRLSDELNGVLPPLALKLIAAGEETGQLDELTLRAADSYDREVSRRLKTMVSLLEPVLIIVFGIVVGFVALAMLQAIYSINPRLT